MNYQDYDKIHLWLYFKSELCYENFSQRWVSTFMSSQEFDFSMNSSHDFLFHFQPYLSQSNLRLHVFNIQHVLFWKHAFPL